MLSKDTPVGSAPSTSRLMGKCCYPPRRALSGYGTCTMGSQRIWPTERPAPIILPLYSAPTGSTLQPLITMGGWGYGTYALASWWEESRPTRTLRSMSSLRQMGRVWWLGVGMKPWSIGIFRLGTPSSVINKWVIWTKLFLHRRKKLYLIDSTLATWFVRFTLILGNSRNSLPLIHISTLAAVFPSHLTAGGLPLVLLMHLSVSGTSILGWCNITSTIPTGYVRLILVQQAIIWLLRNMMVRWRFGNTHALHLATSQCIKFRDGFSPDIWRPARLRR